MDGKMLARLGAIVFVAVAHHGDRDRDDPEGRRPAHLPAPVPSPRRSAPRRPSERRCQQLGEAAAASDPPTACASGPRPATASSAAAPRRRRPDGRETIHGRHGVIDNFSGLHPLHRLGFGLLGGEVGFIATTLIVIDVTLAALFWSWGADDDIIARLVKDAVRRRLRLPHRQLEQSRPDRLRNFAGLGLKASGTGFSGGPDAPGRSRRPASTPPARCSNPSPT